LGNCCSCYAHQVKGLKGFADIAILQKNDNSTFKKPNVMSSMEARDENH
jgi:hypothetical protein